METYWKIEGYNDRCCISPFSNYQLYTLKQIKSMNPFDSFNVDENKASMFIITRTLTYHGHMETRPMLCCVKTDYKPDSIECSKCEYQFDAIGNDDNICMICHEHDKYVDRC